MKVIRLKLSHLSTVNYNQKTKLKTDFLSSGNLLAIHIELFS